MRLCLRICFLLTISAVVAQGSYLVGNLELTFNTRPLNYDEASSACTGKSSKLLVIDSGNVFGALMSYVSKTSSSENTFWTNGVSSKCTNQSQTDFSGGNPPFLLRFNRTSQGSTNLTYTSSWENVSRSDVHNYICSKDISTCSTPNTCKGNAKPKEFFNSTYSTCLCTKGFQGEYPNCTDIDECTNSSACPSGEKCSNTNGSYKCLQETTTGKIPTTTKAPPVQHYLYQFSQLNTSTNSKDLTIEGLRKGFNSNQCENIVVGVKMANGSNSTKLSYYVKTNSNSLSADRLVLCYKTFYSSFTQEDLPTLSECTSITYKNLNFPATRADVLASSTPPCGNSSVHAQASMRCITTQSNISDGILFNNAIFDTKSFQSINCSLIKTGLQDLKSNINGVLSSGNATVNETRDALENITGKLQLLTSSANQANPGNLTVKQTKETVQAIEKLDQAVKEKHIQVTSNTFSSILNTAAVLNQQVNQQPTTGSIVVRSLESFGSRMVLPPNETTQTFRTNTIVAEISDTKVNRKNPQTVTYSPVFPQTTGNDTNPVTITLPGNALVQGANQQNKNNTLRVVVVVLNGNKFLPVRRNTQTNSTPTIKTVITVQLGQGLPINNINPPVKLQFNQDDDTIGTDDNLTIEGTSMTFYTEKTCRFWNKQTFRWDMTGCSLNLTKDVPVCQCNHLTDFALLVSTFRVPKDTVLDIVSTVGTVLSLIALFLVIVLYSINKQTRVRISSKIQLHIFCNLFIAYLVFTVGIQRAGEETWCTVITAMIHYFFLVTFLWMAIYSNNIYYSLIKVFHVTGEYYLLKACLIGYVIPLVIVALNIGLTIGYFDNDIPRQPVYVDGDKHPGNLRFKSLYRSDHMCWIHDQSLYYGFLLIVGLVLLNNLIIVILVTKRVVFKKKEIRSTASQRSKTKQLVLVFSMSITLGLSWIFGFFYLVSANSLELQRILSWIFTLLTSFQGVLLFYLTCVRRKEMFNFWYKPLFEKSPSSGGTRSTQMNSVGTSQDGTLTKASTTKFTK